METNLKKHKVYIKIFWILIIASIVSVITIFTLIATGNFGFMPSFEELENPTSKIATRIITDDGVEIGTFYQGENRSLINYPDISPYMIDALLAIEDIRYRKHSGIDFRGLGRVAIKSVLLSRNTGGGSTITQQLAKNLYRRDSSYTTINFVFRKFKEWVIAVKLERSYTKEEIIAMYLNQFDFLNNAVGIKTAARVYFNTSPAELNIEQSAMLAALHKNPSFYNPLRFAERVISRRNLVLSKMCEYKMITQELCDSLSLKDLDLDYKRVDHKLGLAPSFRQYLRITMTMRSGKFGFDQKEWDNNPLYGWCHKHTKPDGTPYNIYRDGLRIYTTIDSRMQEYAQESLREHLKEELQPQFNTELRWRRNPPYPDDVSREKIEELLTSSMKGSERYNVLKNNNVRLDTIIKRFRTSMDMNVFSWEGYIDTTMTPWDSLRYYKKFLRGGLITMVPQTGYVKAYVGSIDFQHFQYDQVNSGINQVGSIFKPFLYTLAYENGYSPCTEVSNVPVTFKTFTPQGRDTTYTPKYSSTINWDGKMVPLSLGLAKSLNQISAWIMREFNPQAVIDIARKMGVRSDRMEPYYPLCVGTAEMKLSEITRAFSTFANKGFYVEPVYVSRIEDKNGNVIEEFKTKKEVAISEITAYKMLKTMEGVTQAGFGTGRRLRRVYEFDFPIAGKTGTTNKNTDGWFVGITPDLITGVWTGGEGALIRFKSDVLGQGANMALPVYGRLMQKILADSTLHISTLEFESPEGYDYDRDCYLIRREQERKRRGGIIDEEF